MDAKLIHQYIEKRAVKQVDRKHTWLLRHNSPLPQDSYVYIAQYHGHMTAYAPSVIPSKSAGPKDAQLRAGIRLAEQAADESIDTAQQTRGIVTVFSRRSRLRMIKKMSSVRNLKDAYFVTLTYPGEYKSNPERVKRDLDVLIKRLKRAYADVGYIWRIELKKRLSGASEGRVVPHYHMIITGTMTEQQLFRDRLKEDWQDICCTGFQYSVDELRDHGSHGVDVKRVENEKHAMWYVSKYAAKVDETDYGAIHPHGRHWGSGGNLDTEIGLSTRLTRRQWVHLKRLIAAWMKSKGSKFAGRVKKTSPYAGATVFGLGDNSMLSTETNTLIKMIRHARVLDIQRYNRL